MEMHENTILEALGFWRSVTLETVRRDAPDLTSRQMALLLTVYLTDAPHTVRGLASQLNASKPAITRALDTLGQMGFVKRKRDETDKRNVLVQRTVKGSVYLREFADIIQSGTETAQLGTAAATLQ